MAAKLKSFISRTSEKKTPISLAYKVIIMFLCMIAVSTATIGVLSYVIYRDDSIKSKTNELLAIAQSTAGLIDPVEYREIMSSMQKNDYHDWLAAHFTRIVTEHNLLFVHAGELDVHNGFTGFVEALIPGADFGTNLGQVLPATNFPQEAFDAMNHGKAYATEPIRASNFGTTVNGFLLAAYAPIFDENGITIAIVSVTVIDTDIYANSNSFALRMFIDVLVVIALTIWIPFFYIKKAVAKPLALLQTASNKIAQGDMDIHIPDMKTNDEVGLLAKDFKRVQKILSKLNSEISSLAISAVKGDLSKKMNAQKYEGGWGNLANELNHLLEVMTGHNVRLVEANQKAEYASRAKSDFLATMSHEIRTPMNAIIGVSEIELEREGILPETEEAFFKIYNSGQTLMGIINDILDMSKIETGKFELVPVRYETASLINDTVQLNIMRLGSKQIEFNLMVSDNLPSELIGDELRIKQIINNLLSNAIKYTSEGRVTFEVSTKSIGEILFLVVAVQDTGQGMTQEQVAKLFDEYSQFNKEANRTIEGSGLGMSITKSLVEMMDGRIEVKSEPGVGSVFTVYLTQQSAGDGVIGKELADHLKNFKLLGKSQMKKTQIVREPMPYGKVLVVDDVDSNLYVARGLLLPYGLSIETALSGFEAIEKIQAGAVYDIIFLDHMMPEMDGIETIKRIRALGYAHPVVALTANAIVGQAAIFLKNSFDDFISKPIDIRILNAVLNKLVRDKQPQEVIEERTKRLSPPCCFGSDRETAEAVSYSMRKRKQSVKDTAAEVSDLENTEVDKGLLYAFMRDYEKMMPIFLTVAESDTISDDELRLFTVNAHGIKSALTGIGENTASELASSLEEAGEAQDKKTIKAQVRGLIDSLQEIKERIEKQVNYSFADKDENPEYLAERLEIIRTACENYDDMAVYDTLSELEEMSWTKETKMVLDKISGHLLHSDFDAVGAEAAAYLNTVKNMT